MKTYKMVSERSPFWKGVIFMYNKPLLEKVENPALVALLAGILAG